MVAERWIYPGAVLARPVDGDTFVADLRAGFDFGFHVTVAAQSRQRFRLNRINTAPARTASGAGAAARTAALLGGGPFTVASVGPYAHGDEWMAEVTLADGRNLSDLLVSEQWAAPWNGRGTAPLPPWPRTINLGGGPTQ